ncbi:F-box/WD-40 repeat-containing protein At3g52030 isoform X2 [Nicotiana tabacum]|uniref:F-box/WD-40 repeat-containing protein At3g52030 isoform X1 n=1 Tax=Nicotiana tabacum TaxID=4097 RepID=A0A1S3Y4G0_TOBAC|nr:PREDICTED: F-box/WD-40 repeat-containing protein At3g52030-like isoform X1 [Nicotiana tabacum]
MDPSATTSSPRQPFTAGTATAKKKKKKTTAEALSHDVLCIIFSFLDLFQLIRCSAVSTSWRKAINKLKLNQTEYVKQRHNDPNGLQDASFSQRSLSEQAEQLAMERHALALQRAPASVIQWKGHSVGVNQCRMKMGKVLTGVGDKVMRLWSAESCKCLDEYFLVDKAPLIDFDFDEGKVVGLVGTRICIWNRTETRNVFSSRENLFTKGLCMRYVDPEAVIGCEDGKVRVFDLYSRKCSQIIKMHEGPVTCLAFTDDQLLVSGSSLGTLSLSDLSSDQRVVLLGSTFSAGIKTLCFNPSSYMVFAGSTAGNVSCWDLRKTNRTLWETRVSPNVVYSMHHLRNDTSTLVVGGIDGVLRIVDQVTGEVISRCIMDDSSTVLHCSTERFGTVQIESRKLKRLSEDDRIDLMPRASRPQITCLAVGMEKVVTTHNDKYIRVWKFRK